MRPKFKGSCHARSSLSVARRLQLTLGFKTLVYHWFDFAPWRHQLLDVDQVQDVKDAERPVRVLGSKIQPVNSF